MQTRLIDLVADLFEIAAIARVVFAAKQRNSPQRLASIPGGPALSPRGQHRGVRSRSAVAQTIDDIEWRCPMMKLVAAMVMAAIFIASPAFAQSYDPDLGSGNIVSGPPGRGR